jgi:hypothetical protein
VIGQPLSELEVLMAAPYIYHRRFESTVMKGRFIRHTPESVTLLNLKGQSFPEGLWPYFLEHLHVD